MSQDLQKYMDKLHKLSSVMENLIDLAVNDNKISEDEKNILFSINKNLEEYAKLTIEVISDGKVSVNEDKLLTDKREKIIQDAKNIASRDGSVSVEERRLLNLLVEGLTNL
jgi:hypothetical protein